MKKSSILWMFAMLMLAVGISSCNSNYEDSEPIDAPLDVPPSIPQARFQTDYYHIGYSLRNEKGITTSTFKEGENIYFDVTINNTTEYELHLGESRAILCRSASIFRSDDEYVGNPFDHMDMTMEYRMMTIEPHGNRHWYCPWTFDERYVRSLGYDQPEQLIKTLSLKEPLPKGTYYSMLKAKVQKRLFVDSASGDAITGIDEIELKIPFIVE